MKKTIESIDSELAVLHSQIRELKRKQTKLKSQKHNFKFKCCFELTLSEDLIWPKGEAPLNPTAKDVMRLLDEYESHTKAMIEWCLEPEYSDSGKITVTRIRT